MSKTCLEDAKKVNLLTMLLLTYSNTTMICPLCLDTTRSTTSLLINISNVTHNHFTDSIFIGFFYVQVMNGYGNCLKKLSCYEIYIDNRESNFEKWLGYYVFV